MPHRLIITQLNSGFDKRKPTEDCIRDEMRRVYALVNDDLSAYSTLSLEDSDKFELDDLASDENEALCDAARATITHVRTLTGLPGFYLNTRIADGHVSADIGYSADKPYGHDEMTIELTLSLNSSISFGGRTVLHKTKVAMPGGSSSQREHVVRHIPDIEVAQSIAGLFSTIAVTLLKVAHALDEPAVENVDFELLQAQLPGLITYALLTSAVRQVYDTETKVV